MKRSLSIILLFFICFTSFGQVSLETTLNDAVYVTNLDGVGKVYYGVDFNTSECFIYNTDFILWKTISIAPPANTYLYDVAYVSTKLFNVDDQVELLAVFTEYVATGDTSGYYKYTTKIVNEVGVSFLNLPGAGYSTVYNLSDTEAKLLCFVYDFSVSPYNVHTRVYGVPGTLNSIPEPTGLLMGNAFPNPATNMIHIPLSTESQQHSSQLTLLDVNGTILRQESIPPHQQIYQLNTQALSTGTYFYIVETNGRKSVARKIVVN
ncbi:MAG: T9SS type A sorting domain-containing protein [Bacteroidales bacterium]|jgi:hypothetical protein